MKVGELLNDRYLLLTELGRGSSGTVLKAKDTLLGSTVCVKFLREGLANDEHVVERFKRELLLARRLSHPGICKAFDLQQVDDTTVFLVMEFVDGESLAERLNRDRHPMSPEEAVRIVYGAADAVGVANAQKIVHRDLKPGNVLIRDDESIVVVDFGIATAGDMDKLTTPGLVLGSSRYISPERWLGEEALPPSDVWSLGVILYGCLTARLPFDGEGPFGAFEAMQKGPPDPPKLYNPDVGDRLQAILKNALAYKKEDRYPDAGALARALETIIDPSTKSLPRPESLTEGAIEAARKGEVPATLDPRPTAPTNPGQPPAETLTADGILPWGETAPPTAPERALRTPDDAPEPVGGGPAAVTDAAMPDAAMPDAATPDAAMPDAAEVRRPPAPATTPEMADTTPMLSGAPLHAADTLIGPPPEAPDNDNDGTTGDEVLTDMDRSNDLMDVGPTLLVREPRSAAEGAALDDDQGLDDDFSHDLLRGQRNLKIVVALGAGLLVLVFLVLALRGCGDDAPNAPEESPVPLTTGGDPDDAPAEDETTRPDASAAAIVPSAQEDATTTPPTDKAVAEGAAPDEGDDFDFASDDVEDAPQSEPEAASPKAEVTQKAAPAEAAAKKSPASSGRRAKTPKRTRKRATVKRSARTTAPRTEEKKAAGVAMRDVAAAIKAKGLLPGDASSVDRAFKALKKASRRKDYSAVVRLAGQTISAVDATKIDRKLVDRKLTRFNRRYDAVTDANKKQKLDRAIAKIRAPFQRGDFAGANRALNQAFAEF